MADQRRITDLLGDLPATSDSIAPQSVAAWKLLQSWLADAVVTLENGHGQIYLLRSTPHTITVSQSNTWYECDSSDWVFNSDVAHYFDMSEGDGRLTYIGTTDVVLHVACTASLTCVTNNQVLSLSLGINGTPTTESEAFFKLGTGADAQSTALHLIATVSAGDYVSLFIRNETGSNDVTVEVANIQAMSMAT